MGIVQLFIATLYGLSFLSQAAPTVVLDDFNDGDTNTQHPILPENKQWIFYCPSTPCNDVYTQASAGADGTTAARWEPTDVNQASYWASINGIESAFGHTHDSPAWQVSWDECWYANNKDGDTLSGSSLYESTPQIAVLYNLHTTDGDKNMTMWLSRRSEYEDTMLEVYRGSTLISSDTALWPGNGYLPLNEGEDNRWYRYYLRRSLDCKWSLYAETLNAQGSDGGSVYTLYSGTDCIKGETLDGGTITDESFEVTDFYSTAAQTDDGFDANQDNFELLSLANDWGDTHPANFDHYVDLREFETLGDGNDSLTGDTAINDAVRYCTHVYVPPIDIYVDNPLEIDREYPLFIMGVDSFQTRFMAGNTALDSNYDAYDPLFKVVKAPILNFTKVAFWPDVEWGNTHAADVCSILFENTVNTRFELLNSQIRSSKIDIKGPGLYVIQGSQLWGFNWTFPNSGEDGCVRENLLVDHDDALLYMVGGEAFLLEPSEGDTFPWGNTVTNVHQKKGRLNAYGHFTKIIGDAPYDPVPGNFWIESPSKLGSVLDSETDLPHVLAAARTEAISPTYNDGTLLFVGTSLGEGTTAPVDVIVKGYDGGFRAGSRFVNYNAAGVLYLIGNKSYKNQAEYLVEGDPGPTAKIVAFGNIIHGAVECYEEYYYNNCNGNNCYYAGNTAYTGDGDTFVADGRKCNCSVAASPCNCDGNTTCIRSGDTISCDGCRYYYVSPTVGDTFTIQRTICDGTGCAPESSSTCECDSHYSHEHDCDCIDGYSCAIIYQGDSLECVSEDLLFTSLFGASVRDASTFQAGNIYDHKFAILEKRPLRRFVQATSPAYGESTFINLSDYDATLEIPNPVLPEDVKLSLPRMNFALPDMIDLQIPFGNTVVAGNGTTDDTEAIQWWLDQPYKNRLYFGEGTYKITKPLGIRFDNGNEVLGANHNAKGGWIAGAGLDGDTYLTVLEHSGATPNAVLQSQSLSWTIISGIKFKTAAYDGDTFPNVSLDNTNGAHGLGGTVQNQIHDCSFEGGQNGLAIGLMYGDGAASTSCDTHLVVDSEFTNTQTGFATGHYNALNNLLYDVKFDNNDYAFGAGGSSGMGIGIFRADITNTNKWDAGLRLDAPPYYLYGVNSSSGVIVSLEQQSFAGFVVLFDNCNFTPANDGVDEVFGFGTIGGPIFLHSTLDVDDPDNVGMVVSYGFKLHSDILYGSTYSNIWDNNSIYTSPNAQLFELED
jgi:hypothetical protein